MSQPSFGALSRGQIFHGRYEIVRCLRAGGMGAVYECIHLQTRKHRALKVMLPQLLAHPGLRERFELEARVTADVESDHIVETFDAGVDEQTAAPFLVMELLRGEDLSRVLKKRGRLSPDDVVLLLSQAARALDKTHAAGIVHRDLKPDNLYVTTADDGSPRIKILDFGIAKVVADASRTAQQTATLGTPLYMPPEQIHGEGTIGPQADVYALGHIAFTLLTGRAYWDHEQETSGTVYAFWGKVVAGLPEPATRRAARRGVALPAAFDAWFARATARSADDRFDRASTLVNELAVVLGVLAPHGFAPRSAQIALGSDPAFAPTQRSQESKTQDTSSTSIGLTPRRSSLALVAVGVLGSVTIGSIVVMWTLRASPPTRPAPTAPTMDAQAPDLEPPPLLADPPPSIPTETSPVAERSATSAPPSPSVKLVPSASLTRKSRTIATSPVLVPPPPQRVHHPIN